MIITIIKIQQIKVVMARGRAYNINGDDHVLYSKTLGINYVKFVHYKSVGC